MAGKDGQTCPNAAMWLDSECMHTCTCMECQREMGGGGVHLRVHQPTRRRAFRAGGGPNCPRHWNGRDGWPGPNVA